MEPAASAARTQIRRALHLFGIQGPEWRSPVTGRKLEFLNTHGYFFEPQWSTPLTGGSTGMLIESVPDGNGPQRSPSAIGGSPQIVDLISDHVFLVAMEPTVEQREHLACQ